MNAVIAGKRRYNSEAPRGRRTRSFSETAVETWKEFDHNEISHSAAHHLMAVDDLIRKFGYARVSDVARMLNITRGSVSITLKSL